MPMLLKKPESTTSIPVMSRVQVLMRSFETIPNSVRRSKTFQAFLAENREGRFGAGQRIAFARNGFDQRGFAAAVWSQDGRVFARLDAQGDVVQYVLFTAHYGDVVEVEERGLGRGLGAGAGDWGLGLGTGGWWRDLALPGDFGAFIESILHSPETLLG